MRALLLVDLQNDFFPGGSLAVKDADKILPAIHKLLEKKFEATIASKDWHPADHGNFATTHRKKQGEIIQLAGVEQVLWPVHCVQSTPGAQFAPGWDAGKVENVFHKGIEKDIDSYSTFFDNGKKRGTGLESYLRKKNILDIFIAGLTTEYCVKYSVLDALQLGFNVYVIADGCRAVNLHPEDEALAYEEMRKAGAHIISSDEVT